MVYADLKKLCAQPKGMVNGVVAMWYPTRVMTQDSQPGRLSVSRGFAYLGGNWLFSFLIS